MAHKNLFQIKGRRPGQVVTQLNKIIRQNIQLVTMRERAYIKEMVSPNNSLYWMENRDGTITSCGIIDHSQTLKCEELGQDFYILSHLIPGTHNPNHIQEILEHINIDFKNHNLLAFLSPKIANAIGLLNHKFVEFSPQSLLETHPKLANLKTNFFNFKNLHPLHIGAQNHNYFIYLRQKTS